MMKCVSKWFLLFFLILFFFFFNLANEWMSVICPHRKGKRCWLSEYKLDTPMSSLAKDELSVSMVTRSSLSYGYPLTSLWSYFLLYSRPYRHMRASARRRHTLPNTQIFFPSSVSLLLFLPPLLLSHSAPFSMIVSSAENDSLSSLDTDCFLHVPGPSFSLVLWFTRSALYKPCTGFLLHTHRFGVSIDLPASWLWLHACEVVVLFFFSFLGVFFESQGSWDPSSQVLEKCLS